VLEGFRLGAAAGAGGVSVRGPPSWVGGQIALSGSHLVDSPGNELAQAHETPWGHGGSVQVVPQRRKEGGPLLAEFVPNPFLQSVVGVVHQGLGREGRGGRD